MQKKILVTGGAGFIGSNFILQWLAQEADAVVNLDHLTYAGNAENLESATGTSRYHFVLGDICDRDVAQQLFQTHKPRALVHFAAESHVDRSIHGPEEFVRTNINGTFSLLEAARLCWRELPEPERGNFRFLQVSTDE